MALTEASIDKGSGLEIRIGAKSAGAVTITALLFPGVSMLAGAVHESGTTTVKAQQNSPRPAVLNVWAPLLKDVPKGLPTGDEFELVGRVGGKTLVEVHTTLAAARANPTLASTVTALLDLTKATHPGLSDQGSGIWAGAPVAK